MKKTGELTEDKRAAEFAALLRSISDLEREIKVFYQNDGDTLSLYECRLAVNAVRVGVSETLRRMGV